METRSAARKRRALEACAGPSVGEAKALGRAESSPDGEAKAGPVAEESEEWALAGRLLELDNPVLLRIARQADLRTLVALERTCRRLNALSKEAGDCGAICQVVFTMMEGPEVHIEWESTSVAGRHFLKLRAGQGRYYKPTPKVEALGRQGFLLRLCQVVGPGNEADRKRLDGLLEHLLGRGARPSSLRLRDFSYRGFQSPSSQALFSQLLARLAEDSRVPALQGLLLDGAECCDRWSDELEEVFAKQLPQLRGLLCTLPDFDLLPLKYPSLLYACLERLWGPEEERAELLKRLRCLVLKPKGRRDTTTTDKVKEEVERLSGGRLRLRSPEPIGDKPFGDKPFGPQPRRSGLFSKLFHKMKSRPAPLRFACEDFDPAELRPLCLGRIWDEGPSNQ